MERYGGFSRRWPLFSISFLGLLLLVGEPNLPLSKEEENPMEKREEKLKAFREKRDRFFKEDPQSPEPCPTESKFLCAVLPTNKGKENTLQIYRPLGGGEFFLPFKDKNSGTKTYSEGRYLYIETIPGGEALIDFNRAYNPFCQYSDKYTYPLAPDENWLDIGI